MEDEKYVYLQDLREKKVTGYSARKQRSHCGKGGRVKFPSDYLTKKELKKMSGECKSYRLNSPMTWDEFRDMPKDLQIAYIKAIKEKYNPTVTAIGKMMGADRANLSRYLLMLGFEKQPRGTHSWDKEGFAEWCFGVPKAEEVQSVQEEVKDERTADYVEYAHYELPVKETEQDAVKEEIPATNAENISFKKIPNPGLEVNLINAAVEPTPTFAIPTSGSLTFKGDAISILNSIKSVLGGANVHLVVQWDVVEE